MAFCSTLLVVLCVTVSGWAAPTGDFSETFARLPALQEEEYHEISPELLDIYKDFQLLDKLEKGNITNHREGRGLLSKLYFLTGLKLGSLLTSSGTLAASNSIRILGKVLNSAISVSYGSSQELLEPIPIIPIDGGSAEEPEGSVVETVVPVVETEESVVVEPKTDSTNTKPVQQDSTVAIKNAFLKEHNDRVSQLNKYIEGKFRTPRKN